MSQSKKPRITLDIEERFIAVAEGKDVKKIDADIQRQLDEFKKATKKP